MTPLRPSLPAGRQGFGGQARLRSDCPSQAWRNRLLVGDVRERLAELPTASVETVITSPPYFALRNYGMKGQYGLEPDVGTYVERLRPVMAELARVLVATGSLWLNLGDSYSRHLRYGAPAKSLLLAPERLLLALAEDGWLVRNKIVWAKANPRPASVRDRLSCTWEPLYLLVRSPRYFFDLDAIRVPHATSPRLRDATATPQTGRPRCRRERASSRRAPRWAGPLAGDNAGLERLKARGLAGHPGGKNPGDVWRLASSGYRGAHFATFPEGLVERPLLASCPERVCTGCQTPWRRSANSAPLPGDSSVPGCNCRAAARAGLVLDPFMGSGTVAVVAERRNRDWCGVELNPVFAELAGRRLAEARGSPPKPERRTAGAPKSRRRLAA